MHQCILCIPKIHRTVLPAGTSHGHSSVASVDNYINNTDNHCYHHDYYYYYYYLVLSVV